MSKIAVLTNDLVEKSAEHVAAAEAAAPPLTALLAAMRRRGHEVVHLVNRPATPGADVIAAFLEPGDIVIGKGKDSGLHETGLHDRLRNQGVDTVLITGMQTQRRMQTIAADALVHGYNVWVPSDCVISTWPENKEHVLEWLEDYCATVAESSGILHILDAEGGLPRKEITIP